MVTGGGGKGEAEVAQDAVRHPQFYSSGSHSTDRLVRQQAAGGGLGGVQK